MSKLQLQVTSVFSKTMDAYRDKSVRYIVHQGGTRSSKTYSILQFLVWYCLTNIGHKVSIVRQTVAAATNTVQRDLNEILETHGLVDRVSFHSQRNTYTFPNGASIKIWGVYPDPHRVRGAKHDLLFLNEADAIDLESFLQLDMRLGGSGKLLMDFNPSDPYSWIFEQVLEGPMAKRARLIHSTYLDNPFLTAQQRQTIESLKDVDPNAYEVYTLGKLPVPSENVFHDCELYPFPQELNYVMGMDFGMRDPNVLVKVARNDRSLYVKQLIYKSGTPLELLAEMNELQIRKDVPIYCDSSRPDIIQMLRDEGYAVDSANKNIAEGIDWMNEHQIRIDTDSPDAWKEFRSHKYKVLKNGQITNTPVDYLNHAIDAARYAAIELKKPGTFKFSFI